MTPREKLDLLKSYRAAGGTGSYVSLIKEVKQYNTEGPKGKKVLPELSPYTPAPAIAESTKPVPYKTVPIKVAPLTTTSQKDVGEINVADDDVKFDTSENKDYWSYKSRIKRNVSRGYNNTIKVLDKVILPSAALASTFSGAMIPSLIGSGYLGNEVSKLEEPTTEGVVAISGQLTGKFPLLSEPIKRVGGMNDLKTAYNEFSKGNISGGLRNVATGIGGVYDSRWIPGSYDDIIDKGLELLNLYGDANDVYQEVKHRTSFSPSTKKYTLGGKVKRNFKYKKDNN